MIRRNPAECILFVALLLLQCVLQHVMADSKDSKDITFTYEFLDKNNRILKLRCHDDCSTDYTPGYIVIYNIYNRTSQQKMATLNARKTPVTVKLPQQEMTFYVGGLLEEDSCYLELLITNFNPKTHLEVGCDIMSVGQQAKTRTVSSQLIIDTTVPPGDRESSIQFLGLIVVIALLLLFTVFFAFMWLRVRRRYRKTVMCQTTSQDEGIYHQTEYGDNASVLSFTKSQSKLSIRTDCDFKLPATNGSIYKKNSSNETNITGKRVRNLPTPPAPPTKVYSETRPVYSKQLSSVSALKLSYASPQDAIVTDLRDDGDVTSANSDHQQVYSLSSARYTKGLPVYSTVSRSYASPQDAIEPDFSEDGDVTSANSDSQHGYSLSSGEADSKANVSFYASVPVKTIDVY